MKSMGAFIHDYWNPNKTWIVIRTNQGKYYVNQLINGRMFYKKFLKQRKARVCLMTSRVPEDFNKIFS